VPRRRSVLGKRIEMPRYGPMGRSSRSSSPSPHALQGQTVVFTRSSGTSPTRLRSETAWPQLAAIVESPTPPLSPPTSRACAQPSTRGRAALWYKAAEIVGRFRRSAAPGGPLPPRIPDSEPRAAGERLEHFETAVSRKRGVASTSRSPCRRSATRRGGSWAPPRSRATSPPGKSEAELSSYREDLEHQVRGADRRAGTLTGPDAGHRAPGGARHPVGGPGPRHGEPAAADRMRLDALEQEPLPGAVREDLKAIAASAVYLQRLASSLRMFAIDPDEIGKPGRAPEVTSSTSGSRTPSPAAGGGSRAAYSRNGLARPAARGAGLPFGLVAIAPQRLMQAVFNLVQNAGEAINGQAARQRAGADRRGSLRGQPAGWRISVTTTARGVPGGGAPVHGAVLLLQDAPHLDGNGDSQWCGGSSSRPGGPSNGRLSLGRERGSCWTSRG